MKPGAQLYVPGDERAAIIAPLHQNIAGIYYEQDVPLVIENWRDARVLGGIICDALKRFSVRDRNLREYKKSDWPAYKASGCKTVKAFEAEYVLVAITAVNGAATAYDATIQPKSEDDIRLLVSFMDHEPEAEIGRLVLKLVDKARHWRL